MSATSIERSKFTSPQLYVKLYMYIKVISNVIFGTDMYVILMFITMLLSKLILLSVCELNTPLVLLEAVQS